MAAGRRRGRGRPPQTTDGALALREDQIEHLALFVLECDEARRVAGQRAGHNVCEEGPLLVLD